MSMVFGNQSWDLPNWRVSSSPIPMRGATTQPASVVSYQSDGEELPTLSSDERINENGYITNAPKELAAGDFLHRIVYARGGSGNFQVSMDSKFTDNCGGGSSIFSQHHYTSKKVRDSELPERISYLEDGCDEPFVEYGEHYWVDETQGPFTVGCGDADADNFSEDADYYDSSLCTYSCDDPNRNLTDVGACGDCKEGYGLNDDGVCEQGIASRFVTGIKDLPWEMMGAGLALLIMARFVLGGKK